MYVPPAVPWNIEWVLAARAKLNGLRSPTSFVSVVFFADPDRLWSLSASVDAFVCQPCLAQMTGVPAFLARSNSPGVVGSSTTDGRRSAGAFAASELDGRSTVERNAAYQG